MLLGDGVHADDHEAQNLERLAGLGLEGVGLVLRVGDVEVGYVCPRAVVGDIRGSAQRIRAEHADPGRGAKDGIVAARLEEELADLGSVREGRSLDERLVLAVRREVALVDIVRNGVVERARHSGAGAARIGIVGEIRELQVARIVEAGTRAHVPAPPARRVEHGFVAAENLGHENAPVVGIARQLGRRDGLGIDHYAENALLSVQAHVVGHHAAFALRVAENGEIEVRNRGPARIVGQVLRIGGERRHADIGVGRDLQKYLCAAVGVGVGEREHAEAYAAAVETVEKRRADGRDGVGLGPLGRKLGGAFAVHPCGGKDEIRRRAVARIPEIALVDGIVVVAAPLPHLHVVNRYVGAGVVRNGAAVLQAQGGFVLGVDRHRNRIREREARNRHVGEGLPVLQVARPRLHQQALRRRIGVKQLVGVGADGEVGVFGSPVIVNAGGKRSPLSAAKAKGRVA